MLTVEDLKALRALEEALTGEPAPVPVAWMPAGVGKAAKLAPLPAETLARLERLARAARLAT